MLTPAFLTARTRQCLSSRGARGLAAGDGNQEEIRSALVRVPAGRLIQWEKSECGGHRGLTLGAPVLKSV